MISARSWRIGWLVFCVATSVQAAPADAPSDSWFAQMQSELIEREYRASATDLGLQAPNRAQGFRTYFDAEGISLVTRDADAAPLLGLRLLDYGRKQALHAPGAAEVVAEAAQVTQRWSNLDARYHNRADGLTQALQ